jgi:peptidyl-prolyl cis-trans isomerase C
MLRFDRIPAPSFLAGALSALLLGGPALAQAPAAPPPPAAPAPAAAAMPDPVVARVNGVDIRQSDLRAAAQAMPENTRGVPQQMLYPMLLEQAVDGQVLLIVARKAGLEKDPVVAKQMSDAADRALQTAMLGREIGPLLSEDALRARYARDIGSKPGEEEVHARHILVADEAEAKRIIAELKKGGDFAAIAKKSSTDPGGAQGGDLGFFRKSEMVPEFANAAFAMKPGEISAVPVKTQFGWHVIKLEERRTVPPPTFEAARDEMRQKIIQEAVAEVIAHARQGVSIELFNPDGSAAAPAPAAAQTPAAATPAKPK